MEAQYYEHFGEVLRENRTTAYKRRAVKMGMDPDLPQGVMTQSDLIACMKKKGYSITSGAYSEIETGISLPKDPRAFIDAVAICMSLDPNDPGYVAMNQQFVYDRLSRLGERFTDLSMVARPVRRTPSDKR